MSTNKRCHKYHIFVRFGCDASFYPTIDFSHKKQYNNYILKVMVDFVLNDIKNIVAKNIAELRQARGMTQFDLAEQLNYTDKAVSKWERGESIPDVTVLLKIADLFGVSLDFLVREEHTALEARKEMEPTHRYSRGVITCVSLITVWFVALFSFVILSVTPEAIPNTWLAFIYAIPVTAIVWLVLNSIWFNRRFNYVIISVLMWTGLLSIHLTAFVIGHQNPWECYLLGIPGQLIIIFWSMMKLRKKKNKTKQ